MSIDVMALSDDELASFGAKIAAERRRRGNLEFQPELPTESGQGWTVQSGRAITAKEQS